MMRFLLALLVSLPLVAGPGQQVLLGTKQAAAGGTCTTLVALLGFGANIEQASTSVSQKIKNTAGMTVCSVSFVLKGTGDATCGLFPNADGSGTQIGTTSAASALPGTYGEVVFTWASNPTVSSSTDFYLVVSGTISGYQSSPGDDYENGNGYDGYRNGTPLGAGVDTRFGFSTIQ
jgi:hypothetical protein